MATKLRWLGCLAIPLMAAYLAFAPMRPPDPFGSGVWEVEAVMFLEPEPVTTYRLTHYVDGQPAARSPVQFDIPLRVGDAELGNCNIATHRNKHPVRHFSGCMDEFLLFARALSDAEVERLYTQGRPPP